MWLTSNLPKRSLIYLADMAEERARIARELHDGIAQELAAIGYALDAEIGRTDTTNESRRALRAIREDITHLNSKVRLEIYQLRSSHELPAQKQLEEALGALELDCAITGRLPVDPSGLELSKVIIELARNAHSHGHATSLHIDISTDCITLENDGLVSDSINDERHGLVGIAERLESIGWEMMLANGFTEIEIRRVN